MMIPAESQACGTFAQRRKCHMSAEAGTNPEASEEDHGGASPWIIFYLVAPVPHILFGCVATPTIPPWGSPPPKNLFARIAHESTQNPKSRTLSQKYDNFAQQRECRISPKASTPLEASEKNMEGPILGSYSIWSRPYQIFYLVASLYPRSSHGAPPTQAKF